MLHVLGKHLGGGHYEKSQNILLKRGHPHAAIRTLSPKCNKITVAGQDPLPIFMKMIFQTCI